MLTRGARWVVEERGAGCREDLVFAEEEGAMPGASPDACSQRAKQRGAPQLATLGSGNHFVEVCLDGDDSDASVWLVLHSGSRGIGNQLARIHIEHAKGLMKQRFIDLEDPVVA